ncbi:MAG: DUF3098 domain-containing protein [Bacteroidales bacterium]|nr:DUF3098 domain-containing protein [Bacteroidales bacterium]
MKLFSNLQIEEDKHYTFSRTNYILIAVGVVILLIGFILLSGGASSPEEFYPNGDATQTPEIFNFRRLTLAPIVILFGFFFEIFAILWSSNSKKENN